MPLLYEVIIFYIFNLFNVNNLLSNIFLIKPKVVAVTVPISYARIT